MSRPESINIDCKQCGSAQSFTAWRSLNASLNPEARESLLKGELLRFVCRQCGASAPVCYPLLYHDMERQLMIQLAVGDEAQGMQAMPIAGFMKGYQFRVVTTPNQLVEKIHLFEAGLDDRVVEFLKFLLRRGAGLEGHELTGELLFNGQGRTDSGEPTIQFLLLTPNGIKPLITPMSQVDAIIHDLGEKLPSVASESGRWLAVNEDYAVRIAERL